ncbi:MAG: class I SAM-dependent methyltransferase, partial [Gammaproteobacteria bacterium]|nr:class I SAM-dependent methyltransferase [Gammaproteobacteria bacterium]
VPDASLDFIIANHMLEHCENPLGAIRNYFRTVRKGGVLYYAVPDKRFSFDRDRPLTQRGHFIADDRQGPAWSRSTHFDEWVRMVVRPGSAEQVAGEAERLERLNYSIHFHVWDFDSFMEYVDLVRECMPQVDFDWTHIELNVGEIVSVFTKR